MSFKIEFDTENAAFVEHDARCEIIRILERVIYDMRDGDSSGHIKDWNGNTVGHWGMGE
jgi:hypothetical protein